MLGWSSSVEAQRKREKAKETQASATEALLTPGWDGRCHPLRVSRHGAAPDWPHAEPNQNSAGLAHPCKTICPHMERPGEPLVSHLGLFRQTLEVMWG